MSEHKYYTEWDKFWDFYMESVKNDVGDYKFQALKNSSSRITQNLSRITDEFRLGVLDDLVREAGMIPDNILLFYDPKATTFYSAYSRAKKRFYIGYPTFTKYMCYWEPAMKAAFRHEMGHILRGDCLLTMPFSDVRNSNCCMDIRINDQLDRNGLLEVYKCMNFKDKDQSLLVPEEQFGKIDLPYDEENPFIPEWWIIANKFNKANKKQRQENDKEGEKDEPKGFEIGDYVIVDTKESPYDGDPGKIVDIDEEGNFVVESISEEEFDMLMEAVKDSRMQLTTSGDLLGVFTKSEIISAIPEEEGEQGEYGEDEDEEGQGGDSGGDDDEDEGEQGEGEQGEGEGGEGESGEGESGDDNKEKTPEEIIKEKEEILEDLLNGGVDGNNQGEGVWSDELSEDEDEEEEPQGKSKEEQNGDDVNEDDDNDSEGKDSEGKDSEGESGEEISEEQTDIDKVPDWTEEQTKRKEEIEEKIKEINLNKSINKSIDNFNNIKEKHKEKLTQEEMMYIDVALEELADLKN